MKSWKKCRPILSFLLVLILGLGLTFSCQAAGESGVTLEYEKQELQILNIDGNTEIPEGFESKELKISDHTVKGLKDRTRDLQLVLARDESGTDDLYIYKKGVIQTLYQTLEFSGKSYVVLPLPDDQKERVGYKTASEEIQGKSVSVWKNKETGLDDYCQLYLMNEAGETAIYQYEATEGTIQKVYEATESVQGQEDVSTANDENEYELLWDKLEIYFAIAVFILLAIITLLIGPGKVVMRVNSKKRAEYYAEKIEASYGEFEAVLDQESMKKEEEGRKQSKMLAALQSNIYVPELVSAVYGNSKIELIWQTSDTVQGYNVYRKTQNGKWKCIKQIQGNETGHYTDGHLETNAVYTYTVRAFVLLGEEVVLSDYNRQGITEVALHGYQPAVPKLLNIRNISDGVCICWKANPEADCYMIYRKENGGKWDKIDTIENAETAAFTDTCLKPGISYEYTVRTRCVWNNRVYDSEYENPGLKIVL